MPRGRSRLLFALATAVLLVAACGDNSGPPLTDPKAIVEAALKSTEAAKTVHVDVTVDGVANVALPGGSGIAAPVTLTGTTASADVDIANGAAHATFSVPALFGFSGDLIVVGGKSYLKTTQSGGQYEVTDLGHATDSTTIKGVIDNVGDLLLGSKVTLAKGDDIACGSKSCYTVTTTLTAEEIAALAGAVTTSLPIDLTGATVTITARVEKDSPNHLAGLTVELKYPDGKTLKLDATFSKWDDSVSITAPPADQVKGGS